MGADLAQRFPEARAVFEEADDTLGIPLSRIAWEGPEHELTATINTQPALLTHSVAVYRVIASRLGDVVCAAGHSLGEFTAHVVAGALTFADGVRLVRRRGELMHAAGQARHGTMAAVIGLDDAAVADICDRATSAVHGTCVPANYNSPGQVVISGDVAAVEQAMELAKQAGARPVVRLNVSGAFHSPLMAPAEAGLAAFLESITFQQHRFPVIANVNASAVADEASAKDTLVRQLTSAVRWSECVLAMRDRGVKHFVELGPGQVLTKLLRRIERSLEGRAVGTVDDVEALPSLVGAGD